MPVPYDLYGWSLWTSGNIELDCLSHSSRAVCEQGSGDLAFIYFPFSPPPPFPRLHFPRLSQTVRFLCNIESTEREREKKKKKKGEKQEEKKNKKKNKAEVTLTFIGRTFALQMVGLIRRRRRRRREKEKEKKQRGGGGGGTRRKIKQQRGAHFHRWYIWTVW